MKKEPKATPNNQPDRVSAAARNQAEPENARAIDGRVATTSKSPVRAATRIMLNTTTKIAQEAPAQARPEARLAADSTRGAHERVNTSWMMEPIRAGSQIGVARPG